jgi:hypothetical protein
LCPEPRDLMSNGWHGFAVRNARARAQLLAQDLG